LKEDINTVSKYEIRVCLHELYDLVGIERFDKALKEWKELKKNIIRYYGVRGTGHSEFIEIFYDGDYILTRVPVDENKNRLFELFRRIGAMVKEGGFKFQEDSSKGALFARLNEIYSDIVEAYRIIMITMPNTDKGRATCVSLANLIGDELTELRNMERKFQRLGDQTVYKLYNQVRQNVGRCEAILPRILDSWRSANVKNKFQSDFAELFSSIEDLMSPVKEKDLKDYEDKILQMLKEGATFDEIAKELAVDVNTLAVHIKENMDIGELV